MIPRRNYPSWSGAESRDKDRDTLIEQSQYYIYIYIEELT